MCLSIDAPFTLLTRNSDYKKRTRRSAVGGECNPKEVTRFLALCLMPLKRVANEDSPWDLNYPRRVNQFAQQGEDMKSAKYLVVLAIALFAIASASNAQTVEFLGGGSSALALELGQAAGSAASTNTPCIWTQASSSAVLARDNRTTPPTDEKGDIWVTWGPGTGTCAAPVAPFNIYSYMKLDSVVGDKCYFEVDSSGIPGCVQVITVAAGTAGANKLCDPSPTTCTNFGDSAGGIPQSVINALNGQHYFVIGTDIRPEDAKFASLRMFTACNVAFYRQPFDQGLRQTYGLGYQTGTTGVGTQVKSDFGTQLFNVLDFNIQGNDPITTPAQAVPAYTVLPVGAQPMVITVSPAGGTGIGAATDINGFTLALFQQGVLGRATDLFGPTTANTVTTLIREPLSGTYNTMEFSVPNSSQFHTTQDDGNCNGSGTVFSNPMHIQSANGQILAYRRRVIGTGQMVSTLQAATTDTLGYFFWSAGNASAFTTTNGKYLTVNGVDPLKDVYTDGVFPGVDASHPLSAVSFKWLNQGDYAIWSALRLVTKSPTPAGVTNVIAAAQTLNSTQHDFITLANLRVVHSHFYLPAINQGIMANGNTLNPATPNDLCPAAGALVEIGGDAGGANVLKQANFDFCTDYGNQNGLINKTN
jgi:hypothetical protein